MVITFNPEQLLVYKWMENILEFLGIAQKKLERIAEVDDLVKHVQKSIWVEYYPKTL